MPGPNQPAAPFPSWRMPDEKAWGELTDFDGPPGESGSPKPSNKDKGIAARERGPRSKSPERESKKVGKGKGPGKGKGKGKKDKDKYPR